jgi:hypothetical protein
MMIALVIVVAALILVASGIAYLAWESQRAPSPKIISTLLKNGSQSDWGYGGSASVGFNLTNTRSVLRGAFATNTSLILYVMTSNAYQEWKSGALQLSWAGSWYYSTGDVREANVSVSLSQGQWFMLLDFVNDTGQVVQTFNGTSIFSVTHLTITQTFTVAPESDQAPDVVVPYGPSYADIKGQSGSNVTAKLTVNMSQAGTLLFEIGSESFSPAVGNGSTSQAVSWVVPLWVTVGTTNYSAYNNTQGATGWTAVDELDQGSFPLIVSFEPDLSIQRGAPAGQYTIILNVYALPLDHQGTAGITTFTIDLTVT